MSSKTLALVVAGLALAAVMPASAAETESDLQDAVDATATTGGDYGFTALAPARWPTPGAAAEFDTLEMRVGARARHEDPGDLDDDLGDVEVDRYGGYAAARYTDDCGFLWVLRFDYEYSDYDVDTAFVRALGDELLDTARMWNLTFSHVRRVDEEWSAFGGVGLNVAYADGAEFSDSANFMGAAGAMYHYREDLEFGLGVFVKDDFEDSPNVMPMPVVNWNIDDLTRLTVRGPRLRVTRAIDKKLSVSAFVESEVREYRLDDDHVLSEGSVEDSHVTLGVGGAYRFTDWFRVGVDVGLLLKQEYEWQDDDGDRVEKFDMDDSSGFFVGIEATLDF